MDAVDGSEGVGGKCQMTVGMKCRYILRSEIGSGSSHGLKCTTWDRLVLAFGTARRGRGRTKARGFVVTDLRMAGSTWNDDAGVVNNPRGNIFPAALEAPRGRQQKQTVGELLRGKAACMVGCDNDSRGVSEHEMLQ